MALRLVISGLAASGKTTIAKRLARRYKLKMYAGSDFLKNFAKRLGLKPSKNWWDTEEGMQFLERRKANPAIDRYVDAMLVNKLKKGNVVITSWTLPYLNIDAIKVFLHASKEERARRLAKRDKISVGEALKTVEKRDRENNELYKIIYGFELGKDLNVYDLVVDTTKKTAEDVEGEIIEFIEKHLERKVQGKKG